MLALATPVAGDGILLGKAEHGATINDQRMQLMRKAIRQLRVTLQQGDIGVATLGRVVWPKLWEAWADETTLFVHA